MAATPRLIVTLAAIALLLAAIFAWRRVPPAPSGPPIEMGKSSIRRTQPPEVKVLGWIPYWDQASAFASFRANASAFDYLGLFWYRLDPDGAIQPYAETKENRGIIDFAHQKGVKALAVVANLPDYAEGGDWDWQRVERVIASPEARRRHITELVALAESRDFDGINIDYEALRRSQRENFTAFIRELAPALHAEGKILGVALHPKTSEDNPSEANGSPAQDWNSIAEHADQLYLMTYSQHHPASNPGPNASPAWVEGVLDYALDVRQVPREKLFFGIPLYGHEWVQMRPGAFAGVDDDVTFQHAAELAEQYGVPIRWDENAMTPYLTFRRKGRRHVIWFENRESFKAKLELRERYRIPNIALWRLGGEDPRIWGTIMELKNVSDSDS